jgi:hypothetical protein
MFRSNTLLILPSAETPQQHYQTGFHGHIAYCAFPSALPATFNDRPAFEAFETSR